MLLYAKLAWGNLRRTFRDFAIYFATLMLSVALFYSFSTLTNQTVFVGLGSSTSSLMLRMGELIRGLSIFLMIIIGILIVYANIFFMRRRVREFATYLLLGMKKTSLALVILIENILVGISALVAGLIVGVVISQFSSLAILKLFNTPVERFHFLLIPDAFVFTACMFACVFLISTFCATLVISRTRLSTLFRSSFASERFKMKNPWITLVLFLVSLLVIAHAYNMFSFDALTSTGSITFLQCTLLVVFGTALFFYSVSAAFTQIARAIKPWYYRGLTVYVMRQFASRINSSWISMTMICATIFIALCTLSIGFAAVDSIHGQEQMMCPTDVAATFVCKDYKTFAQDEQTQAEGTSAANDSNPANGSSPAEELPNQSESERPARTGELVDLISQEIPSWNTVVKKTTQCTTYGLATAGKNPYTVSNLISDLGFSEEDAAKDVPMELSSTPVLFVTSSEYNKFRDLAGMKPIDFGPNEVMMAAYPGLENQLDGLVASGKTVTIAGKFHDVKLQPKRPTREFTGLTSSLCTLVVPDAWARDMKAQQTRLYAQFFSSTKEINEKFSQELTAAKRHTQGILGQQSVYKWHLLDVNLRYETLEAALAIRVMGTFVAVYTGIILLITSAAILSIQQLSELSYMQESCTKLQQLGATRARCSRAIFSQLGIWFMLPCALAITHAACVMKVVDQVFGLMGADADAKRWLFVTAAIVLVTYVCYFLVTFAITRAAALSTRAR